VTAAFKLFRPSSLEGIVDAIWDWDVPHGHAARALTIKHPPGTSVLLLAPYRAPVRVRSQSGWEAPNKWATQIHTRAVSFRPSGPLGLIVVSLNPEAASRILDISLPELANAKIDLRNLFSAGDVSWCDQTIASSRNSRERIATVEAFLLRLARQRRPDSIASLAASLLRHNPALRVTQLASRLNVAERHLSRSFRATFGISPKNFARLARIEMVLAARLAGAAWAEAAYACGFADQAHLVSDFKKIIGELPTDFFNMGPGRQVLTVDGANFVAHCTAEASFCF
jgi:AraC-like DNA-binding protein